jgi:hypothetical protein
MRIHKGPPTLSFTLSANKPRAWEGNQALPGVRPGRTVDGKSWLQEDVRWRVFDALLGRASGLHVGVTRVGELASGLKTEGVSSHLRSRRTLRRKRP